MTLARRAGRAAVVILILLTPIVTGAVGYYLGLATAPTPTRTTAPETRTPVPTWIDREILRGAPITTHCTYHLADGTTRVRDQLGDSPCPPAAP